MAKMQYNALDDCFYDQGLVIHGRVITQRVRQILATLGVPLERATEEELDWAEEKALNDTINDLFITGQVPEHCTILN